MLKPRKVQRQSSCLRQGRSSTSSVLMMVIPCWEYVRVWCLGQVIDTPLTLHTLCSSLPDVWRCDPIISSEALSNIEANQVWQAFHKHVSLESSRFYIESPFHSTDLTVSSTTHACPLACACRSAWFGISFAVSKTWDEDQFKSSVMAYQMSLSRLKMNAVSLKVGVSDSSSPWLQRRLLSALHGIVRKLGILTAQRLQISSLGEAGKQVKMHQSMHLLSADTTRSWRQVHSSHWLIFAF